MFNYRKKIVFLDVPLHRLLCNALIQTHFACTAWYSNLKVKNTLEVIQNKCIRFYLKLQCREDMNISNKHFQRLNQLPINQRFKQYVNTAVFKLVQSESPSSVKFSDQLKISITTRNSYLKLGDPFRKTSTGQSSLSYIGPAFWDRIPEILKKTKNFNTFFRVWLFNFFCTYLDLLFL